MDPQQLQAVKTYIENTYELRNLTAQQAGNKMVTVRTNLLNNLHAYPHMSEKINAEISAVDIYLKMLQDWMNSQQQVQQTQQNPLLGNQVNNGFSGNVNVGQNMSQLNAGWASPNQNQNTGQNLANMFSGQQDSNEESRFGDKSKYSMPESYNKQKPASNPEPDFNPEILAKPLKGFEIEPFLDTVTGKVKEYVANGANYYYKFIKQGQNVMNKINLKHITNTDANTSIFTIDNNMLNKIYLAMKLEDENSKNCDGAYSEIYRNHLIPITESLTQDDIENVINQNDNYISIITNLLNLTTNDLTLRTLNSILVPIINETLRIYLAPVKIKIKHIKEIDELEEYINKNTDKAELARLDLVNKTLTEMFKSGLDSKHTSIFSTEKYKVASISLKQKELYIANEMISNIIESNEFKNDEPLAISKESALEFFNMLDDVLIDNGKRSYHGVIYTLLSSYTYHVYRDDNRFLIIKK